MLKGIEAEIGQIGGFQMIINPKIPHIDSPLKRVQRLERSRVLEVFIKSLITASLFKMDRLRAPDRTPRILDPLPPDS